jgi:hypothetical protein
MIGVWFLVAAIPLIAAGLVLAKKRRGLSTALLVGGFGALALWAFAGQASS